MVVLKEIVSVGSQLTDSGINALLRYHVRIVYLVFRKVRTFGRNPNGKVAFVDLPSTAAAEDEKCLDQNRPAFSVAPTKRPTHPGEQR